LSMRMPRGRNPVTRQHIVDVADQLFNDRGCRAVGMDEIVRVAGLGKMTLYRHFPTKDDLVVGVLESRSIHAQEALTAAAASARSPLRRLRAVITAVAAEINETSFRGCPFQNAMAEFRADHPAQNVVRRHQQALLSMLRRLAVEADCRKPERLAEDLLFLINGAYATARVLDPTTARRRLLSLSNAAIEACTLG
jgi:AcrR family transcriptional regulator